MNTKIFETKAHKILELFFIKAHEDFSIRGIARELKLNPNTVKKYLIELEKIKLILKKETTIYPVFYANTVSDEFRELRIRWNINKIKESGLVEKIYDETIAGSIILFGSISSGTEHETSDIDIFVESRDKNIDLRKYEKELGREINLLFEPNINDLEKGLKSNIINGIRLKGFIDIEKEYLRKDRN